MDVYIPLAIYVLIVSVLFRNNKKLMFVMVSIPLLLFWGTREDFGADYSSYKSKYEYQHDWDLNTYLLSVLGGKIEPGYFLLMKMAPDYNSLVFICALIYSIGLFWFLYEFVPKRYLTLAFIMFLFCTSSYLAVQTMRSSITLSLFLMACIAKLKGNMKLAVLLALLSATFHMSGLLLVFLLLLRNDALVKRYNVLSVFLYAFVLISFLVPNIWASSLKSIVGNVGDLSDDYGNYIYNRGVGVGFYILSLIRLGYIVYILSLINRRIVKGDYVWFAWITILYYALHMIQNVEIIYRFCTYLYFITIIFKCYVLMADKTKASRIFVGISIIYMLFSFYSITMDPANDPTNQEYHTFLF